MFSKTELNLISLATILCSSYLHMLQASLVSNMLTYYSTGPVKVLYAVILVNIKKVMGCKISLYY